MPVTSKSQTAFPASSRMQKNFQIQCAELFAELVQIFGVPKSVGQIYGVLYATPEPLSFSDIVEQLNISKGSASQGLQLLRSLGAVRHVEQLDDRNSSLRHPISPVAVVRRDYYEPELSLRKLVSGILHDRVAPMATVGAERLKSLRQLARHAPHESEFYLDRVKQLEIWRRRLNTVLPVFSTMLGPKSRK